MDVVGPFFGLELRFVAYQFEGGRNDLFLPLRQRFGGIVISSSSSAAATLLPLVILASERPDLDEVNIRRYGVHWTVGIDGLSIVRDEIARLEIVFFQEEGMGC